MGDHYMDLNWKGATKKVVQLLQKEVCKEGWQAKIYTWHEHEDDKERQDVIGIRVSEVDFCYGIPGMSGSGGNSFMQVDIPWGACVCLLTERLILAYAEQWPKEEIEEEEQRLLYALKQE